MAYTEDKLPSGLDAKTTPIDADVVIVGDSADSDRARKTTWANVKATLKTYFDTLYGDVSKVGTPANNQIAVWTGDGTLEGEADITYNGTDFYVEGNLSASGSFVALSGLTVGAGIEEGVVTSNANTDLKLKTGNATTGNITIVDGADGAIQLNPNGSGEVQVNGEKVIDETGGTMTGAIVPADHGTATDPEVVAVVYGTGDAPEANTTPIGTLFVKYTA